MQYDVLTPRKVVFGWGRRSQVGELAGNIGRRALIVCGSRTLEQNGTLDELCDRLRPAGVEAVRLGAVTREPLAADIDALVGRVIGEGVRAGDFLLGIGGGAALDTAKAVAAMATNRQGTSIQDFLEEVGCGLAIDHDPLPMLAIPTTAGTGTEATKNAVISSFDPPFKKSLRHERMVPDVVIVDPELTVSCPPHVTAQTGMDAITQLIESFVSRRATAYTRGLCREGIRSVFGGGAEESAIVRAVEQPQDRRAREAMSHAALLSGMALANSGLGLAHGVAAALGVHANVPHGLACAVMLPAAMRVNRGAALSNIAELGRLMSGGNVADDAEAADAAIDTIESVNARIGIPSRLKELGVRQEQLAAIVSSSRGNSMSGNPQDLDDRELTEVLRGKLEFMDGST
ncbi:MAG: iron-containing alcohol dehydrogenase [Planctomycetaceae bacterium]